MSSRQLSEKWDRIPFFGTHAMAATVLDDKYVSTVSVSKLETDCFYCLWSEIQSLHSVLFLTVSVRGSETLYLWTSAAVFII